VAFVDFGMVGSVTKSMKRALRDLFLSFVARDSHAMVNALNRLGFIGPGANMAALERGLGLMLEQYYAMTLGEVRDLDISEVTEDIRHLVYGEPFMIPAHFAFIGRAVSTLVGVSTGLAPDFRFLDVATPYARKFFGIDAVNIEQTVEQLLAQLLEAGRILLNMPRTLEQLMNKLDAGQLEVKAHLGLPEGKSDQRKVLNLSGSTSGINSFAVIVVFVISITGGILLDNAHHMITSWFCFGLAAITALRLLFRR
jgi:predicted unusual protein kinase regulating ubiquinone biosynthesis (AarF/ABC1/UbiB family)